MFETLPPLLAAVEVAAQVITLLVAVVLLIVMLVVVAKFGALWLQAYMSGADVSPMLIARPSEAEAYRQPRTRITSLAWCKCFAVKTQAQGQEHGKIPS